MILFTLNDLIKNEIYLGHKLENFDTRNFKFIYKIINHNLIIDLIQTAKYLINSYIFLYKLSIYKNNIIFIDSKFISKNLIKKSAIISNQYYINYSWISGLITNWKIIKNNILLLNWFNKIKILLKNKKLFKIRIFNKFYKKLNFKYKNLKYINIIPNTLFIVNINYDIIAFKEAFKSKKIIISIVDTNINSNTINIPIPGNNKNYLSIKYILKIVTTALLHGKLKSLNLI
uniref:30S ribosomal protein S2 n=1 Tax=Nephromyces sp. ex Molgula occidentalis TaxID=2544991 RepID=A0A5C1H7R5_9APIC|nr:30S ribosomal protein S2 [Nephromyces sp. ex Molgula occidentalis]